MLLVDLISLTLSDLLLSLTLSDLLLLLLLLLLAP